MYEKAKLSDDSAVVKVDEAVVLLGGARRNADKLYTKEMFNSISKQAGMFEGEQSLITLTDLKAFIHSKCCFFFILMYSFLMF